MLNLKSLPLNQEATIVNCEGCPLRIQEMGILPGKSIIVEKVAPLGDTVIVKCGQQHMCLRLSECPIQCIISSS